CSHWWWAAGPCSHWWWAAGGQGENRDRGLLHGCRPRGVAQRMWLAMAIPFAL
ncbi:hypothetical protein PHYSODRAFT_514019, partial [Phytophthora sojae]